MKVVFWCASGLIAYAYIGYPCWLWLRLRLWSRPVRASEYTPAISIVMVIRNEGAHLERKLRNLFALDYPAQRSEFIIVSDGSTDETNDVLRRHEPGLRVISIPESKGKAAGLNEAVAAAHGDLIVFTDARQKIEAGALRELARNFADPEVGCASGELMIGDPEIGESAQGVGLYWRIEKQIREMESACGSVAGATGALYAARRELVPQLPPGTILDDVYIPMHVVRRGFRVVFAPKARAWDIANMGMRWEFARKVRTLAGNYQLVQLAPWLLSGVNPIRFEFISHKLTRLAVPFALGAMFISSLLLKGLIYRAALVLQLVFYTLGLLSIARLKLGPLGRAADAICTFLVLNIAAFMAFLSFVTRRRVAWGR
jgi:poly-beta-1,6-N-acetyl-D-glucosamine synthase